MQEAIKFDAQATEVYTNYGASCVELGHIERAIEDLDEAIRLDPQCVKAYNIRGVFTATSASMSVLSRTGPWSESLQSLEKAKLKPGGE
tara:strand:- start:20 stop:286 length:267 start_codon:yes stop_codon:yes gene_type:complete